VREVEREPRTGQRRAGLGGHDRDGQIEVVQVAAPGRAERGGGQEVEQALIERDRADAPNMLRAPEAVIVDTTRLSAEAAIERIVELARERGA
jgi:hypothetical protein